MNKPHIIIFDDLDALSAAAALLFQQAVERCALEKRPAFVAVSGGSTPKRLFQLLAAPPYRDTIPWASVQLFWVDERPVPKDDPDSNYRLVRENLLSGAALPEGNVHRVVTETGTPAQAADAYAEALKAVPLSLDGWPRFDLLLLGMGPDGHTASLFPHSPGLLEERRWAIANRVEKLGVERITLTYPVINHAAEIVFLITGADKADALNQVLHGPPNWDTFPSQGIAPVYGSLTLLLDRSAASKLP